MIEAKTVNPSSPLQFRISRSNKSDVLVSSTFKTNGQDPLTSSRTKQTVFRVSFQELGSLHGNQSTNVTSFGSGSAFDINSHGLATFTCN
jgi:hypothetical protein